MLKYRKILILRVCENHFKSIAKTTQQNIPKTNELSKVDTFYYQD